MNLYEFYGQEKQHVIDACKVCGLCAQKCPIIPQTELADVKPRDIQQAVIDFLSHGKDSPILRERMRSCMKCYGCVTGPCPQGLNSMRTLEICTWEMAQQGMVTFPEWDPKSPDLVHRVLASIQTTAPEYERIFLPSEHAPADTVFFSGCNVYFQPEKLLNALDIMAMIDPEFAFVPGLDYCCGNCHLTKGRLGRAGDAFDELLDKIAAYQPKTVVLWCPTCFCLAETTFGPFTAYPFRIQSMAQYVSGHLDKLEIVEALPAKVTIHDACKVALTGLDVVGSREIVNALGAEIVEMPRSGEKAVCCGCAAIENYPEAGNQMLEDRINEAVETGAGILATVCHYCNQMLASRQENNDLAVESYINLLAASLGIKREDRFRKYMHWADAERILADAAPLIEASPFSRSLIEQTVREVFETPAN
jgi:heterodisulfide reductase subunit D